MAPRDVETIYRLTPMQEGMLFHSLSDSEAGVYVEQATCTLEGELEPERLRSAWQRVVARHPTLRTSFHWRELEAPVQVVHRKAELPWVEEDWRALDRQAAEERFRARIAEDARRGFVLDRAPLLRMLLARVGERRWRFLWSYHHLILDGWSLPPLLGQVFDAYADPSAEPPPSRPYVDFVAWLEARDTPEARAAGEAFWRRALDGFEAATPLPGARRAFGAPDAPARGSLRAVPASAKRAVSLSEEATAALTAAARRAGVTPGTVVQAAWALLLARFAGDDDVTFGTVVSGRPPRLAGSGSMIGLFVNSLPVRVRIEDDAPVDAWLRAVQERLVALRDHEHSPLARIQRIHQEASGRPAGEPLFESLVAFENYPRDEGIWRRLGGLVVRDLESHERTHFPLVLAALPGERLYLELAWAPEAFEPGVPERLLDHLETVLGALAAEPGDGDRTVGSLPLLGSDDARRVLLDWSGATVGPLGPGDGPGSAETIHGLVAERARRSPEAVAVAPCDGTRAWSYAELMAWAAAVAAAVRKRLSALPEGAPEPLVAVLLDRSPEAYAACLGVLNAGAAYLPLDPETPARRLREIVHDAGARVAVTRGRLAHLLDAAIGESGVVRVDDLAPDGDRERSLVTDRSPDPSPDRIAYVVYTSGSTGRPKGVISTHRAVVNLIRSARADLGLGEQTAAIQLASPAFDAIVIELWMVLAWGGRVCPVDRETLLSPPAFAVAAERVRATHLVATPVLLEALDPKGFPTVRQVASGGDQCPPGVAARWSVAHRFSSDYGPTEGTVYCLIQHGPGGEQGPPLGRPIPGARLYVVDRRLRPVPPGAIGEVALGGVALARGYLDRPGLTAERFVPHPFGSLDDHAGERLYLTGDLGRLLPNGDVEFAGRVDRQVKIRGHRVEIGEIESVLRVHPAVESAAVVALGEVPHRRLAAFVTAGGDGADLDPDALRRWLAERLPEAMVPAHFERLDALPVTATGKLDRKALEAREVGAAADAGAPHVPPAPGLEADLARVWGGVLGIDRVSADDDFFRLGGDSIVAVRLIARAAGDGIELTPRLLFENPTVARLAAAVERARAGTPAGEEAARARTGPREEPAARPRERWSRDEAELAALLEAGGGAAAVEDVYPLLPLQEGMLFETVRRPADGVYVLQLACRLEGELDPAAFEAAWRGAVECHPVLRTSFHWRGRVRPLQAVRRRVPLPFAVEDWRDLSPAEEVLRFEALVAADRRRGFDPERAPLTRWTLVRVADGPADGPRPRWRFLWSHHHLVLDGWSTPLLLREVFERYRAGVEGRAFEPAPAAPFRAAVERHLAREGARDEAFWRRELAGVEEPGDPGLPPPVRSPGEPAPEGQGRAQVALGSAEAAAVLRFARAHGLTPATVVQGAWALALDGWRASDGVLGVVVSTRRGDLPGIEGTIGPLIDTVPLRVSLRGSRRGGERAVDWLRDLRARLTAAEEHAPISPVAVRAWAALPAEQPLFASVVAFENFPVDPSLEEGVAGVAVRDVRHLDREAVPLALTAVPGVAPSDALDLYVTFDRARYDGAAAERLLAQAATVLSALAGADGSTRLADLPRLPEAERRRLLAERADGGAEPDDAGVSVIAAFRARAAAAPDAPALVAVGPEGRGRVLAYGELARRTEALAAALRRAGAGPEVPVVVLPSSPEEAVAAVLAVLAAGAVYVPLDARHPDARLARTAEAAFGLGGGLPRRVVARPEAAARLGNREGLRVLDPRSVGHGEESPGPPGTLPEAPPEAAAYLIFTSGSTGEPNPVAVPYGALAAHLAAVRRAYALAPGDRTLQVQSLAFDASVEQILSTITAGGCVASPCERSLGVSELLDLVRRERLSVVNLPTALFAEVARAVAARGGVALPALRLLLAGGEAMPPAAARRWRAGVRGAPGARLVNAYGPTEAVVTATLGPVDRDPPEEGSVPIGGPLPGRRAWVVDAAGRLAPEGAVGELWLGGVSARGYAGRPGLTAERFVPDPFPPASPRSPSQNQPRALPGEGDGTPPPEREQPIGGARAYRTGDRARWLAEGGLRVVGRADAQVKIRGFRVEPGEAEAALGAVAGVAEAAVVARGGAGTGAGASTELVGFVVLADRAPAAEEIRRRLGARVPDFLVPARVIDLPALPRTVTGKVDRRELLRLAEDGMRPASAAGEGPRTPLEGEVAAIWREVLGIPAVARDDRFTDLGGHSLLAMRVISRVRERLAVELPLAALFERPTVAELARAIGETRAAAGGGAGEATLPLAPRSGHGPAPASFGQERLWFLDRLDPGGSAYNLPVAVRLAGRLDLPALAGALRRLVARHDVLRTTFDEVDGRPVQRVAGAADRPLPVADLAGLPAVERRREAQRWLAREARRPFDLARGPLVRAVCFRAAPDDHRLLLTLHHAVSDEVSLAVLVGELAASYRRRPLPPLPIQYADWAEWQRRWAASPAFERGLAHWRRTLAGAPETIALPTDRPRGARPRTADRGTERPDAGGRVPVRLGPAVAERLRRLAAERGTTPFVVLLAAAQAWLRRFGAGDDVVLGTPVANRTHAATEELIGFFVNTVAVRTRLGGDVPFGDLLDRVRRDALDALAHQAVPFERVVEAVAPGRSLGHAPLVQAMLAVHTTPLPALDLGGLALEPLPLAGAGAKLDLLLELTDGAAAAGGDTGAIEGSLEYAADLFDRATAERLAGAFERLAAGIADDPGRLLSELPLLSEAEHRRLAYEWSGPGRRYEDPLPLHVAFARRAAEGPDAVAVASGGRALSYGELRRRAARLAVRLRRVGVGIDTPVALAADRNLQMVVGVLGILEAGGAYVPIDPRYPAERRELVLADSGARVAVIERHAEGPGGTVAVPIPDGPAPAGPLPPPPAPPPADALAYTIYTSGSTGRPKGVAVSHRAAARLFLAAAEVFGTAGAEGAFGADAAWSLFHSPAFDFSVWELWGPLAHGGRLEVVPYPVTRDPAAFAELLAARRVTDLAQTPSAFRALSQALAARGGAAGVPALRRIVFGGERLDPAALDGWLGDASDPRPRAFNLYGITETTVHVTFREMTPADLAAPWRSPVGRALPDLSVHVADAAGRLVPPGVPGELLVGGDGLARGYAGRPGLTAERFIPDARSGLDGRTAGARLYRSGDLARWLPGAAGRGDLEHLGRIDQQVKVRGFRIEPGEVEAALETLDGVGRAVVGFRDDLPGGGGLVAWTVPATAADPPAEADLRAALRAVLPEHMVPARFVVLESLPLTPSGKIDRKALPLAGGVAGGEADDPPRSDLERRIAAVWEEVLEVVPVGVGASFFDLGGHSLLATQAVARLREALGVEVPLRELFARPTVAGLARWVEPLLGALGAHGAPDPGAGRIPRRSDPDDRPLSPAQERLWFLDRLAGGLDPGKEGSRALVLSAALRLDGDLDRPALAWALARLRARHDTLRSGYPEGPGGRPEQRLLPAVPAALPGVDLSGLSAPVRARAAARLAAENGRRGFDLARGPLLRALLLVVAPAEHRLLLAVHHLVADGWALGVLVRELAALYRARTAGEPATLPPLPIGYADYARWLRDRVERGDLAAEVEHWRRRLADAPPRLELPTDRPRPADRSGRGGRVVGELPAELAERLRGLARSQGATPFMLHLAAFGLVLGRWAGQPEVVIGAPVAGRLRRETEGIVGLFLNHLALRLDLSGRPSFRELLARARATALDAFGHQEAPFERVLDALVADGARPRDPSRTPVFQVYLNHLDLPTGPLDDLGAIDLPGLRLAPVDDAADDDDVPVHFDLELYVSDGTVGDRLSLAFDSSLFDRWRAEELLGQVIAVLEWVTGEPSRLDRPAADLPLAAGRGRRILPDPEAPLSDLWEGPVHGRLDRWAREAPERVAIAWQGGAVTFARLSSAAAALGDRLAAGGVERGDVVAIRARRSPALVAAVLGTLRAGAAFLLLDPAYPAARNGTLLARARPRAWLRLVDGEEVGPADELEPVLAALPGLRLRLDLPPLERPGAWPGGAPAPRRPPVEVGPADAAYVAFTSGSTGEPKGVIGLHRSLSHFLPWQERAMGLSAEDRFSLLSGLAHDPLHRDLFTPLWLGAPVVVPDGERIGEPGWLAGWAARERVTVAHLTPALGRVLTDSPPVAAASGPPLPDLRRALFVGDVLTRGAVARLRELAPSVAPINLYGSTESQRAVGWWPVPAEEVEDLGSRGDAALPLGRGMPDVQLLVLTPGGTLCGAGEAGEVFLRSPHLAAGYLDDPLLTAERFVPAAGGGRMYRTGDLGRYRGDGAVEALGRSDRQVQVRGYRVEPAEIEAALERHPAVARAAVVARADRLVAYPVFAGGAGDGPDAAALRRFLAERLPSYMVPADFVPLAELPLTPNRKLDRAALPAPPERTGEREAPSVASTDDPFAALVARVFREVLGVEEVFPGADFFDLGGHSLQVTLVLARVRDLLGVELPVRSLFDHPTVGAFARHLEVERWRAGEGGPPALVRRARLSGDAAGADEPIEAPASFGQERIWLIDRLEGSRAYHLARSVALTGPLDPAALRRALARLLDRHEALRSALVERDGRLVQLVQRVDPGARLALPRIDVGALPAARRGPMAARCAAALAEPSFDLARPPLVRALLVRLGPEEHRFTMVLHHAATDGWSMGLLVRDLAALYGEEAGAGPAELPEPAVRYTDYAAWQRDWLQGETLERQLAWWRERLDPPPDPIELPVDRPRSTGRPSGRLGHRIPIAIPPVTVGPLERLAREAGATPFMVVLAAFQALLGRWSGSDAPAVGAPVANRRDPRLESVVGFFVNTLVLVGDLGGDPPFRELLGRTRDQTLGAFAHQDLPFERLVEDLRPARDRSRPPLFQVMLAVQTGPRPIPSAGGGVGAPAPGLRVEPVGGPAGEAGAALFDLALALVPAGGADGGWSGFLQADAALFDRTTARRLAAQFVRLLAAAVFEPEYTLSELPLLAPAERQQVVHEWPRALEWPRAPEWPRALDGGFPSDPAGVGGGWEAAELLHERFERRAAERPDAVAIVQEATADGGGRYETAWSYGAVRERAHDLARRLRALPGFAAAGREPRVGVALDRSPEQIVALLGVLAAGAAYVPLDPDAPSPTPARVRETASRAGVVAIVGRPGDPRLPPEHTLVEVTGPARDGAAAPPALDLSGDRLAYVLFTSGSTGRPKGVAISHRSAAAFCRLVAFNMRMVPGTRRLQLAPLSFDISVADVFPVLGAGGTLVLRSPGPVRSLGALLALCRDHRVEVMGLPTALWHELAAADAPLPPSVRAVAFGGEAALAERIARWRRRTGSAVDLWNGYGPTETTVAVVMAELSARPERGEGGEAATPPLGRPMPGSSVELLDRRGRAVPIGVPGEIVIGGGGVARGYLDDPRRTAESFVPDSVPPAGEGGGRAYRSGDLARWLPDGTLAFLGRADRQVKVRGVRVEPAAVESALVALPGVREAAVDLRTGAGGLGVLVAWIATEAGAPAPDADRLREELAARLPEHSIPDSFVLVDELPKATSGKIDRRRLPDPPAGAAGAGEARVRVAPRTALEREIASVWAEVTERPRVGVTDDFFTDLGGHSLLAVRLAARLEERLERPMPMARLFEHPTVAALAAALADERPAGRSSCLIELGSVPDAAGERPPLVLVHPAGGSGLAYADLAGALAGRSVWALQAPGLDGGEEPLESVDELAERYVAELDARLGPLAGAGPIHLGGWSFGALVAFEMARRLAERGGTPGLVVAIDAAPGAAGADEAADGDPDESGLLARALAEVAPVAAEELRGLDLDARFELLAARARERGLLAGGAGAAADRRIARRLLAVFSANLRAAKRWRPAPADLRVALLAAAASDHLPAGDPAAGWRPLAGAGVEVAEVPGDHRSVVSSEHAATVARALGRLLAEADDRSVTRPTGAAG